MCSPVAKPKVLWSRCNFQKYLFYFKLWVLFSEVTEVYALNLPKFCLKSPAELCCSVGAQVTSENENQAQFDPLPH